jgi:hypothetical protein
MQARVMDTILVAKNFLLNVAASVAIATPLAMSVNAGALAATTAAPAADVVEMKRYRNEQWRFELGIPSHWTIMPTGVANGPNELARFISTENGRHLVLVSRHLLRPSETPTKILEQNRDSLAKKGYLNFVPGETRIGQHRVLTLDFETTAPDGQLWYTRHYYVIKGQIGYQLAFGTSNREAMFDLYDRMAKSFVFEDL